MEETISKTNEWNTNEVQEMISYEPGLLLKKTNGIFLFVFIFLLALTALIRYPDILKASAWIISVHEPEQLTIQNEGKLAHLFVKNEEPIKKGQPLALIESNTNYDEAIQLKKWIDTVQRKIGDGNLNGLNADSPPVCTNLGSIQLSYEQLISKIVDVRGMLANGYHQRMMHTLETDKRNLVTVTKDVLLKKQVAEWDQKLQKQQYEAYETLAKQHVIAPLELNSIKSKLLEKEQNIYEMNRQLSLAQGEQRIKEKQILEYQRKIDELKLDFYSTLMEVKTKLDQWYKDYVITASIDGEVLFKGTLQEGEEIRKGQALFYLQPEDKNFHAQVLMDQKGFAKVHMGQKVILKIHSYPEEEYGNVQGTIDHIFMMPDQTDSFRIQITLPALVRTSYGKEILLRNNLMADAEVITQDKSLFQHFVGNVMRLKSR